MDLHTSKFRPRMTEKTGDPVCSLPMVNELYDDTRSSKIAGRVEDNARSGIETINSHTVARPRRAKNLSVMKKKKTNRKSES